MSEIATPTVDGADVRIPRNRTILRAYETTAVELPKLRRHERLTRRRICRMNDSSV